MNTNKTKKDVIAHLMAFLITLGVLALLVAVKLGYPRDGYYEVISIEKVDDALFKVNTDVSVLYIETAGVNAYPYGLRLIGRDLPRQMRLKTRGARIEWMGLYPDIIEVVEEEEE